MSLLRFAGRSLFAAYFVIEGVRAVTKPSEMAADAEHFTNAVTPIMQRVVPAPYASYVPEKAETWVRISGAAQVVGGLMFATGIGRRIGAVLLAKASVLNLAMALPCRGASREVKSLARPEVVRNTALLGAAILATQDTQGKPSLKWRAAHAAKLSSKNAPSSTAPGSIKKSSVKSKCQQRRLAKASASNAS